MILVFVWLFFFVGIVVFFYLFFKEVYEDFIDYYDLFYMCIFFYYYDF